MRRDEKRSTLDRALARVPKRFVDDGCSSSPDRLFGRNLRPACRAHDWFYCTRAWPAGQLTQEHRALADQLLGFWIRALLPRGLGWIGWLYMRLTHSYGGTEAYDSCGSQAGKLCRHNLRKPAWMLGSRR